MYTSKFVKDYVHYIKLHEEHRMSTNKRNEFWKKYMEKQNENKRSN